MLRDAGKVSLVPETYGCDVLIHSVAHGGPVGIQRKEISDLIASVRDGRLGRQLVLMKQLPLTVLLLEGKVKWTNDGSLLIHTKSPVNWTMAQHHGLLWSIQSRGVWIASVETLAETIVWLSLFQKWCQKPRKTSSLESRPKGRDEFGKEVAGRDFGIHLLQSFPGVGREVAGNVVDHFKGVPLQWSVTAEELREVKGIGAGRAKQLLTLLGMEMSKPESDPFPGGSASSGKRSRASTSPSKTGRKRPSSSPTPSTGEPIDDWITLEMEGDAT